ncbi:uncharacterized protein LOC17875472 [Capsella rubella]|uniref:uncharacterized protein LOC17875472 n=1 Tax=Capsella rubella TaxID=81985 RepID=UPI000CD4B2FA|nr:uncharacterized protein LOC17875472 [Capsella rubella]
MSLLVNNPSKLCFRKPVVVRSSSPLLSSNGVSSSLPQNPPSVIIYVDHRCGADLGKLVIQRAGEITPLEKYPMKEGMVDLNPDTDPKHISLPPLETLARCQTQIVTNVAMSSSCVVAVKFLGPQISFCRPAQSNSQWINIRVTLLTASFIISSSLLLISQPVHLDEHGNAVCTRDIGEISSFSSQKSQPFCVPASSFPGMSSSNRVQVLDVDDSAMVRLDWLTTIDSTIYI